jgi:hypothetical protein
MACFGKQRHNLAHAFVAPARCEVQPPETGLRRRFAK